MLPANRRIQTGRTYREMWRPEDYAGIEPGRRPTLRDRILSIALASGIGASLALVVLVYGGAA